MVVGFGVDFDVVLFEFFFQQKFGCWIELMFYQGWYQVEYGYVYVLYFQVCCCFEVEEIVFDNDGVVVVIGGFQYFFYIVEIVVGQNVVQIFVWKWNDEWV